MKCNNVMVSRVMKSVCTDKHHSSNLSEGYDELYRFYDDKSS